MASDSRDFGSVRTVIVRYPNGDKEYWTTGESFAVGDEIRARSGGKFVVVEVLGPSQTGDRTSVRLTDEAA